MNHFQYRDNLLYAEEVPVTEIAKKFGTPCYIYSRATLERHWHAFNNALGDYPHHVHYAVKANSNLAVLAIFARLNSGFDVVSIGELERVLAAGGKAEKIVFSGVGKLTTEINRALDVGIHCFNVESLPELERINKLARLKNKTAPISLRVNPDIDPETHPYISTGLKENKFGIPIEEAISAYKIADKMANVQILGIDFHIGSQLTSLEPFLSALEKILHLIDEIEKQGIKIQHLNLGGGLGVTYQDEKPPHPIEYGKELRKLLGDRKLTVFFEPGRAIAANAGILLTNIEYIKPGNEKNFAIVDAAMNDLIRPALYQAWQEIIPVKPRTTGATSLYDIVGPVCESGDFLGKERELIIEADDLLAVRSSGAYGFSMSSNYNSRPRVAEIMVDGDKMHLIRERETIHDLFRSEKMID